MTFSLPVPAIGGPIMLPGLILDEALSSASDYARAEKSEATRRAYVSDFRHFVAWCDTVQALPMPASIDTVAAYLAALADAGLKVSTISRRAAAINYAHRLKGEPSPTHAEAVKIVLRGIRRTIGSAVTRKAPATAKALGAMIKLMPDTMAGKRDRALLLIGFAAALRRSELVALDVEDFERAPEGVLIHIRRSKTDQEGEGHVVPVPRGGKLMPVESLETWLQAADITDGAVFRAVAKGDRVLPARLQDAAVAQIVKRWAAVGKLDPTLFSGHSLRAGFVTSALEAGADTFKVMDITRHKSVATLRIYDRRAKAFKNHAGKGFL